MQRESVVVFDEARNIDIVCIEALSVSIITQTLDGAVHNISRMTQEINRLVQHLRGRLETEKVEKESPVSFVASLSCHDASLAIKPVFERFQTAVITSGTLSPIDLYPRLLNFNPVVTRSFTMSLVSDCICPMVLTRGSDQLPVSTKYDMRSDPGVARNYRKLLLEMVSVVPDGVVYMDAIVDSWNKTGILKDIMQHKLVFIETQDVVETTLALDNYRKACDRGSIFSVARGKVAEGIDFDRHYGRLVIMFGVPYQYTLSKILLARMEYLRDTFRIKEGDVLTFDALADYGMMIFANKRYSRHDMSSKLPGWILSHRRDAHLSLSTDMAVHIAREFLRKMAQPYDKTGNSGRKTLLSQQDIEKMSDGTAHRYALLKHLRLG
ncbi:General transcription and DNA repair factor IIH helicase subunit XPD-like protein [Drosera capensis]